MEHLHPKLINEVEKTQKERIEFICKEKWIGYSEAEKIIVEMEALLEYPSCSRMPGLLVTGDTNNGKTALLNRFYSAHPARRNELGAGVIIPVVKVQAPPIPDEKRFYNNILDALNIPFRVNDKIEIKHRQIVHVMRETSVKVLLIDEIHHVLAGSPTKQRMFLNIIKYIANDICISVVCAGTKDAKAALGIDPQLSNRFEPVELPRWKLDTEYLKLLASFEKIVPLKNPSNLHTNELASKILQMSEGRLGEISNIIKRAAIVAIQDGTERITTNTISKIRYMNPELRRSR